jgi:hypothetical protein
LKTRNEIRILNEIDFNDVVSTIIYFFIIIGKKFHPLMTNVLKLGIKYFIF